MRLSNVMAALTLVAAICVFALYPKIAKACSCEAHFEIRYGSFKPDVPDQHFSAHQTRRKGETNNSCRRRAREAAQSCMSGLWRERWDLQEPNPAAVAECNIHLTSSTWVIRPTSTARLDVKREIERRACCGSSPIASLFNVTTKVYKRTHGDNGCGPNLKTVESRFLSNYVLDCKAVRAREECGAVARSKAGAENGYDRPGMDIRWEPASSPGECRSKCINLGECRSWTFQYATQQTLGRCWLKHGVPWAKKNSCCSSGTVR